jgi:hypothetical protein
VARRLRSAAAITVAAAIVVAVVTAAAAGADKSMENFHEPLEHPQDC